MNFRATFKSMLAGQILTAMLNWSFQYQIPKWAKISIPISFYCEVKTLIQMPIFKVGMGATAALTASFFLDLSFLLHAVGPGTSTAAHENLQKRDISPLSHTFIFYTSSFPGVSDTLYLWFSCLLSWPSLLSFCFPGSKIHLPCEIFPSSPRNFP